MSFWKPDPKEESPPARIPGPAAPGELRIISQFFDLLIMCCKTGVDFPAKDGVGIQEYTEMKESLIALADEMEMNNDIP